MKWKIKKNKPEWKFVGNFGAVGYGHLVRLVNEQEDHSLI
jgi:hypothetical protein